MDTDDSIYPPTRGGELTLEPRLMPAFYREDPFWPVPTVENRVFGHMVPDFELSTNS
jgi:hypothetical protein